MKVRATAKIKISTEVEIIKTLKVYHKALQFCVDQAWKRKIKNNIKLHPFVYKKLKSKGLQSQLCIACIKQACGIVKRAKTKPIIQRASIRYNFPRSVSMKNNLLSISTIKGRIKIPFSIPDCYLNWNIRESLLRIDKRGRCFFLFTFSKDVNAKSSNFHKGVLGIDIGVNNIAVTSDRQFFGKNIKQLRIKKEKLVSELQAKGTKSAKRKLIRLSGRWKLFMTWTNHNISKKIVSKSKGIIVMEDLTHIRRNAKYIKWVHKWAFRQLQSFIEYKALRKGIRIVYVNPYKTSKECSVCHNELTSRHSGFFQCLVCRHSLNSDLNASYNIAQRYKRTMCLGAVTHPNVSNNEAETSF
jgi:IS605 OrfB family transposase